MCSQSEAIFFYLLFCQIFLRAGAGAGVVGATGATGAIIWGQTTGQYWCLLFEPDPFE